MVSTAVQTYRSVIAHTTTKNQSFLDMHYLLKTKGIKNNAFFLSLYDADLLNIDPRELDQMAPARARYYKQKVFVECTFNFWYFIREVVRIPVEGGDTTGGNMYKLHRGNLALNFLFIMNKNTFLELPRQHGKTISALCWYLWVFNFGTSNSRIMFINKKHDDSKGNLISMKRIRAALPTYLQMNAAYGRDGKQIKVPNTAETLQHPTNFNKISTLPGARTKQLAMGLGRGCTMPIHYYDEFGFIVYNKLIYGSAMPAFSTASKNAKANRVPYGILITTTPGDLTTDEGKFAFTIKNDATQFSETWYDYTFDQIEAICDSNVNSSFVYVKYTYQQLGSGSDYLKEMVKYLNNDYPTIRREILLEWTSAATNCPFTQEDLDMIKSLVRNELIRVVPFGKHNQYLFKIWDDIDTRFAPIIGVDVSGAQFQDFSAITVIDSKTTKVCATFNCNYIPSHELANLVYDLVKGYMRNAVVNVEANGGFGKSVLQLLLKTDIKKNLYYEIVDRIIEERTDGFKTIRSKQKRKVYGLNTNKDIRNDLIEILHQRVQYHKDKFVSPEFHAELETMEVKKNGKTEHADGCHDDQIFSYLMALYVWYRGKNLADFGIQRYEIATDEDGGEEAIFGIADNEEDISSDIDDVVNRSEDESLDKQLEFIKSDTSATYDKWEKTQYEEDQKSLERLLSTKHGRRAYANKYNLDYSELEKEYDGRYTDIGDEILDTFYEDYDDDNRERDNYYKGNLSGSFKDIDYL